MRTLGFRGPELIENVQAEKISRRTVDAEAVARLQSGGGLGGIASARGLWTLKRRPRSKMFESIRHGQKTEILQCVGSGKVWP